MTHQAWGLVMMAIGVLFILWATTQSTFFLYRMFVARSLPVMGENVHRFYQLVGGAIIFVGSLMVAGVL
jgi:hypothetical protein